MSRGFYGKLAASNMKKNRRFTVPYLLSGIVLVMMFYMIGALASNPRLIEATGTNQTAYLMNMTMGIAGIFSVIMLFYADSFLMKRRKKELGLYNILGMEKKHIGKMLFWETLYAWAIAVLGGVLCGILFSKLIFMLVEKLLNISSGLNFYVSVSCIVFSAIFFGLIYLVSYILHLVQLKVNRPVELLKGSNVGEREPRTKWVIAILGAASLGIGYYMALTIESPLDAVQLFFIAVVFVIAGTYLLFTAGTIALLKMLRKNKRYYYKTNHFTAVSGLIYRMKQNAVGLASICILATMVLVLVSTTFSLYRGIETGLEKKHIRDITVELSKEDSKDGELTADDIYKITEKLGYKAENKLDYYYLEYIAVKEKNAFSADAEGFGSNNFSKASTIYLISAQDYKNLTGRDVVLEKNHALVHSSTGEREDTYKLQGKTFTVDGEADVEGIPGTMDVVSSYTFILPDRETVDAVSKAVKTKDFDYDYGSVSYAVLFDVPGSAQEESACRDALMKELIDAKDAAGDENFMSVTSYAQKLEDAYQFYGGFLFIGIFLAVLFMMGTILIIYYKQMSEGFEDSSRYQIMQSVGMSRAEVRRSIRSQILIVFFLPLAAAAVHMAVGFPMITKLLQCFNMTDTSVFGVCTIVTLIVFAVIYALVYSLTAKIYYKIVTAK